MKGQEAIQSLLAECGNADAFGLRTLLAEGRTFRPTSIFLQDIRTGEVFLLAQIHSIRASFESPGNQSCLVAVLDIHGAVVGEVMVESYKMFIEPSRKVHPFVLGGTIYNERVPCSVNGDRSTNKVFLTDSEGRKRFQVFAIYGDGPHDAADMFQFNEYTAQYIQTRFLHSNGRK